MMEVPPVRIALLGLAHVHAPFWAEAFTADPCVRLERIWDDDVLRGVAGATRFRTLYASDLASAIEAADAVAITSETVDHERLIAAAAAAGKPILCEKPIAVDLAQARAASLRRWERPRSLHAELSEASRPVNHALREVIRSGELGRITLARVRHGHAHGSDPAFTSGWWTDPARSAAELCSTRASMPRICCAGCSVRRQRSPRRWRISEGSPSRAALAALAAFQWPDGMIGEVVAGWTMRAADVSIEIYGTEGTALVSGVDLAGRGYQESPGLWVCSGGAKRFKLRSDKPLFTRGGFHRPSPAHMSAF